MELLIKIAMMCIVTIIIFGTVWLLDFKPWKSLKKKVKEIEEGSGFKVTMKLIESKKWKDMERRILAGHKVSESSLQLSKAVVHKLITVDGMCPACCTKDELHEMNENQMPQNICCRNCGQIYAFCITPEFGAWMMEG